MSTNSNAKSEESLNPCYAGRCSSTGLNTLTIAQWEVSILVMLDDALVPHRARARMSDRACLNPCYAGRCSSTRETETILIINMLQNYTKVIFAFLNQKLTIS